jgi:hypothetical protein
MWFSKYLWLVAAEGHMCIGYPEAYGEVFRDFRVFSQQDGIANFLVVQCCKFVCISCCGGYFAETYKLMNLIPKK